MERLAISWRRADGNRAILSIGVAVVVATGCVGAIRDDATEGDGRGDTGAGSAGGPGGPGTPGKAAPGGPGAGNGGSAAAGGTAGVPPGAIALPGGLRRLSRAEYERTVAELLGETARPTTTRLPEDVITFEKAFDNDVATQQPSAVLIASVESLAVDAAARVARDPARRAALVTCKPTGPGDAPCLRQFITRFGRRALRRPLADDEVERFLGLQRLAVEGQDFFLGVELVVRALLQHPEFVYRFEVGAPVAGQPGLFKLGPYELAARLSYFLVGSMPDEALLDQAGAGKLASAADVAAVAGRLLADKRARERVHHFHAHWLSYFESPHGPELAAALDAETRALVERVVFDRPGAYQDLFLAPDTFIADRLAKHYGLPTPGTRAAWVTYGASARKGILSHGAVLSAFAKPGDTSPTLRGRFVSARLFCREIAEPPPDVDTNTAPKTASPCRKDQQIARTSGAVCQACHSLMDPIGFGLENYDREGKYRAHDDGMPSCAIDGVGEVAGVGTFKGAAGLADQVVSSGQLEACVVKQVLRFATGHHEGERETPLIEELTARFKNKKQLRELLVDLVTHPAFALRREAAERSE